MSPARKRPEKQRPSAPAPDVAEKQDAGHTETDFLRQSGYPDLASDAEGMVPC